MSFYFHREIDSVPPIYAYGPIWIGPKKYIITDILCLIELFSRDMRRVYSMRASIIFSAFRMTKLDLVVSQTVEVALHNVPSYSELATCDVAYCNEYEDSNERCFPLAAVNAAIFDNNMANLQSAIISNLPERIHCRSCDVPMLLEQTFGEHVFIDVCGSFFINDISL